MFKKQLDEAWATTRHSVRGIPKEDVERGMYWQAGIDYAAHQLQGEVYVLSKEEVAHRRSSKGYRPQFYFRTRIDGSGGVAGSTEMVMRETTCS